MEDFLESVLPGSDEFETEIVQQYSARLLALARRELPERIRRRVDPEDVLQSVYRSFFRRLSQDEFEFAEAEDVWRLLTVMTYRKVKNQIKFHRRQQRDAYLDISYQAETVDGTSAKLGEPVASGPSAADLAILVDYLEIILRRLPERHHELVRLRLEGCSTSEIASRVGVTKRTVIRVLAHLKTIATEILEEEPS